MKTVAPVALCAALAACGASPVSSSGPPPSARPSSSSPAPSLAALRSWWTVVRPDVDRLTADLGTGDGSPAALTRDQRDIRRLQADPPFPGSAAGASAWSTALADYASAVADLQQDDAAGADALFAQGTAALNTLLGQLTSLSG